MRPVRTAKSNLVYVGPTPNIGDLHCERRAPGRIYSVWEPTPDERKAIADGANIELGVMGEPIPPVSLVVVSDQGIGEDSPEIARRLREWRERGVL